MTTKLQVINSSGTPLRYATDGSAGIDLPAGWLMESAPNGVCYFNTGVQVAIPVGYVGLVIARSSLHKRGWRLANSVGVIDSDFTGNIILALEPHRQQEWYDILDATSYVAQLVIVPCPRFEIEEVNQLPTTARGTDGFGSTDGEKK